jgi:geranylgeranyl diphosphate synthase type II
MNEFDFDLKSYLLEKQNTINARLEEIIRSCGGNGRVTDAMLYSIMAGGKRVRPVLCMAAAEAVGSRAEEVLTPACALELIHTYSLIHDDLPAMDDDELRRGKPTCHTAFDEATAILAGDALLTLAFQVLSSAGPSDGGLNAKWLRVIHVIAVAAGNRGMIGGQMRDIASEGVRISIQELEQMHHLKTGALIEASISTGAILGDGNATQLKYLEIYARNTGIAFQITDDNLNVEGDPDVLGKAVGTDEARAKTTYPSLLGLKKSKELAREKTNSALQALDIFDNSADPLRAIAKYIVERKS